jgi:glycosyltransferase involved in cell wall biosynthesis
MVMKNRPLISIVTETFSPDINGVANTLGILSTHLSETFRVQVIRSRQPTGSPVCLPAIDHQIEIRSAPIPGYQEMRFGFPCKKQLTRIWQKEQPAAIYVATQGPLGWSAVRSANALGIPVTSGFHTNFHSYSRFYGFGWLHKIITGYLKLFHQQTQKTLVPTLQTAQQIEKLGIKNTCVWSRGVDCARFDPAHRDIALRQSWGAGNKSPVFLYVGRIAAEKNVELAVLAFERAQQEHPDARLVMVGNGPLMERMANRYPAVTFTGTKTGNDLARHYASADVFLFPSETDTFGNVVLEAMASGLAIVSFNDAAAKEHLTHEKSALLAAPGNYDAFCRMALSLAIRPGLISRLGAEARSKALQLNWPAIADAFTKLVLSSPQEDNHYGIYQNCRRLPTSR